MFKYNCLNSISRIGLDKFTDNFANTDNIDDAEGILVRSGDMHELDFSKNLLCIARAGAGVNNIPLDKCAEHYDQARSYIDRMQAHIPGLTAKKSAAIRLHLENL